VNDVLMIGGGFDTPVGPYASTMDILETGLLDRFGIKDIAVAGYPKGSPDFAEASAIEALRQKQAFTDQTGARLRIVTQFGFDPARAVAWAEDLAKIGIDVPVHIGVAGQPSLSR
jgi:methylenetetrahydrofolate reductase (NADPH)